MTYGNAESRTQAAERFAAAAAEYKAALRRPEALGSLADRGSVRYNFVCACVLAAGAGAAAAPSLLQASTLGLDVGLCTGLGHHHPLGMPYLARAEALGRAMDSGCAWAYDFLCTCFVLPALGQCGFHVVQVCRL